MRATRTVKRALVLAVAALAVTGVSACGNSATWYVPVGTSGTLSTMYGPCTPPASAGPLRFSGTESFQAVSTGSARIKCSSGDIVIEVREAARVVIQPVPQVSSGRRMFLSAIVYDSDGHELDLGKHTALAWTFGGSLSPRPNPGCGDIFPSCPAASTGFAIAGEPGRGTMTAAFGSVRGTSTTRVMAR
jgi:hypothetical protein